MPNELYRIDLSEGANADMPYDSSRHVPAFGTGERPVLVLHALALGFTMRLTEDAFVECGGR